MLAWRWLAVWMALCTAPAWAAPAQDAMAGVRLYALDCGRIIFDDMGMFADTGEYDGKPGTLAAPCFLIRHPKGDLLWDAGLGDAYAASADGKKFEPGMRFMVAQTLVAQLRQLGLAPDDIDSIAFSHLHLDHTGNAGLFAKAAWLVSRRELAWAESGPLPGQVDMAHLEARKRARVERIDLDHDVFGDGMVRILRANGHTPGHQVLQLQLAKAGTVVLSGDLYHTRENFERGRMPVFNHSPGETLASMDRVKRLLKATGGRLVVQHEPKDFEALPKFPAYLD